jgi:DNA-binding CsgD family transcriptional regulator
MTPDNPILTKEERDILILASEHPNLKHLGISEISERLGMTETKVKTHIHQACMKLGADNRNEATLLAMKRGEIKVDELLSIEELAEILCSLDSGVLLKIAELLRHNQVEDTLPKMDKRLKCSNRRQAGLLTNRECDVLILSSRGLTNLEIADQLCMSSSAVRTFLNRAFTKLGAQKKADAVQLALKYGEISVGDISSLEELASYLIPLGAERIECLARLLDEKKHQNN